MKGVDYHRLVPIFPEGGRKALFSLPGLCSHGVVPDRRMGALIYVEYIIGTRPIFMLCRLAIVREKHNPFRADQSISVFCPSTAPRPAADDQAAVYPPSTLVAAIGNGFLLGSGSLSVIYRNKARALLSVRPTAVPS